MQPLLKAYSAGIKAFLTDPWVQGTFALILLGKAITNIQEELLSTQRLIGEVQEQASHVRRTAFEAMSAAREWIGEDNRKVNISEDNSEDEENVIFSGSEDAQSVKFSDPYKNSLPPE